MKNLYFLLILVSTFAYAQDLELKGVIDFTVPEGGSDGKAIHLYAINDIADLSVYGIGIANNGGGTDGEEYTFPVMSASAGDHIFLPRSIVAMTNYLQSLNHFQIVIEASIASQNGDDAVELFFNGSVIETFGDIDCQPTEDGTVTCPNYQYYENAWAYKEGSTWTFADAFCTDDGSTTSSTSSCPYPFLDPSLSVEASQELTFSIVPNPATHNHITINTLSQGVKQVMLYDLNGRMIIDKKINSNTLDISQLSQGLYLLQVRINNQLHTSKLIVE